MALLDAVQADKTDFWLNLTARFLFRPEARDRCLVFYLYPDSAQFWERVKSPIRSKALRENLVDGKYETLGEKEPARCEVNSGTEYPSLGLKTNVFHINS